MNDDSQSEKQNATWSWIFNLFFLMKRKIFFPLHHLHSQNLEFIKALNMNWGILFSIFSTISITLWNKRHPRLYKIEIYILKTGFPV